MNAYNGLTYLPLFVMITELISQPRKLKPNQICERIHKFERRRLGDIASNAEQTCFVGSSAKSPSHADDAG